MWMIIIIFIMVMAAVGCLSYKFGKENSGKEWEKRLRKMEQENIRKNRNPMETQGEEIEIKQIRAETSICVEDWERIKKLAGANEAEQRIEYELMRRMEEEIKRYMEVGHTTDERTMEEKFVAGIWVVNK